VAHPQVKAEKVELDAANWDRLNMMKQFMYAPPQKKMSRNRKAKQNEQSWEKELEELEDEEHDYDAIESPAMLRRDAIKKAVEYIEKARVSHFYLCVAALRRSSLTFHLCRRQRPPQTSGCWRY
jgi:hypothetical protein